MPCVCRIKGHCMTAAVLLMLVPAFLQHQPSCCLHNGNSGCILPARMQTVGHTSCSISALLHSGLGTIRLSHGFMLQRSCKSC